MKNICTVLIEMTTMFFTFSLSLLNNFKAIYIVFFLLFYFCSVQLLSHVSLQITKKLGILLYNHNMVTTLKKTDSNSIVSSNTQSQVPQLKTMFHMIFLPFKIQPKFMQCS